ncbi:hypothetical protein BRC81_10570 [Halobacteriales archaeon QS_1_68_20]|nr:MAG: hypothetical protein BRC81_10570 [Halobacteriales archaeon QS_1_68_20]
MLGPVVTRRSPEPGPVITAGDPTMKEESSGTVRSRVVGADDDERSDSLAGRVLGIDARFVDYLFSVALLGGAGLLLRTTLEYDPESRLMPLVVLVPTLVLVGVLVLTQLLSLVTDAVIDVSRHPVMERRRDQAPVSADEHLETTDGGGATERLDLLAVLGWTLALPLCFYVLGMTVGALAYVGAFYHRNLDSGWRRTAAYTAVVWVTYVVVFGFLIETPLYGGLLGDLL